MNEDIIGFVMGALDAQEHQRIEDLVRSDTELQSQVDLIRRSLLPLESYRHCEPPSDLHNQTIAYVFVFQNYKVIQLKVLFLLIQ